VISEPITIHHNDGSPVDIVVPTPARCEVVKVTWFPTENFDGAASTIDIGEDGDHDAFLGNAIITKLVADGPVHAVMNKVYAAAINIRCWITPGAGCTTGEGVIIVQYINMV
jgi:hypothetical protein